MVVIHLGKNAANIYICFILYSTGNYIQSPGINHMEKTMLHVCKITSVLSHSL